MRGWVQKNKLWFYLTLIILVSGIYLVGQPQKAWENKKVVFSYTKHPEEQSLVYSFFQKDIEELNSDSERVKKFGKVTPQQIGIDLYDLNNDGADEIFAIVSAYPTFCWGTGCSLFVFKRAPILNSLTKILDTGGRGGLRISPETRAGHKIIQYFDDIPQSKITEWKWNGKQYVIQ